MTTEILNDARNLVFSVKSGENIVEGMIVAIENGLAVQGKKQEQLIAVGVAQNYSDNTLGEDASTQINVKRGVYKLFNSKTSPITIKDLFKKAYFEDAYTVTTEALESSEVGKILAIENEYVIVEII